MKLIIHACLFASGSVEVDTDTGQATFLCPPIVKDDQALLTAGDPETALKAGNRALAALHMAITEAIVGKVKEEPRKPIPLTNVLGGNGKASA